MAITGRIQTLIVTVFILIFSIIHFGVGVGIIAKYRVFQDVFRPSLGLSGFIIVVGIYGVAFVILSLIVIIREISTLNKVAAICSFILGISTLVSLIVALALNAQAVSFVRTRLEYHMSTYETLSTSNTVMDDIQNKYQCCGANSWLDWAQVQLNGAGGTAISSGSGISGVGTVVSGSSGGTVVTGNSGGSNTNTVIRRRRYRHPQSSPLVKAVRQRRQTLTNSYNFPSSYTITLPFSCCIDAGVGASNTLGGYCIYSAQNGSEGFYIDGCISSVADISVSQITGIAVINIGLTIFAFVYLYLFTRTFFTTFDSNNPNAKQPAPNEMQQEQQVQNGGYYNAYADPNIYYTYSAPTYPFYQ